MTSAQTKVMDALGALVAVSAVLSEKASRSMYEQFAQVTDLFHAVANGTASFKFPEGVSQESVRDALGKANDVVRRFEDNHPLQSLLFRKASVGLAVIVIAPQLAFVLLSALGFGSLGVAAGSMAAAIQSFYAASVPAGGLFAWATSAGAGGYAAQQMYWLATGGWMDFQSAKAWAHNCTQQNGTGSPPS